jgi:GlpG protein
MRIIEAPAAVDLSDFSAYLWHRKVNHRIFEESGVQVVEIADPGCFDQVRSDFEAWQAGRLQITTTPKPAQRFEFLTRLRHNPAVIGLICLTLLLYPLVSGLGRGVPTNLSILLTIIDLRSLADSSVSLEQVLGSGQPWRWLTPVVIHYSILHLTFNCAAVFELGRRVETGVGSLGFLLSVAVIGVLSNLAQVAVSQFWNFGGLSGVAYGLLGFVMVRERLTPDQLCWHLPAGVGVSFLVFLVIMSTGVTELFDVAIANTAHWAHEEQNRSETFWSSGKDARRRA